jgi:hypothetical protein
LVQGTIERAIEVRCIPQQQIHILIVWNKHIHVHAHWYNFTGMCLVMLLIVDVLLDGRTLCV